MANELLITINADAKNATKAFDDIRSQTEDLEESLSKVALVSAAAFAALTAEVYLSSKAYEEGRVQVVGLTNALQDQGIYTDALVAKYKGFAEAVSSKTGVDEDAITKAQGVAQSLLGQTEITQELTQAIVDLGAKMGGDLDAAAEKIGRTIGTTTNAFAKQGVVISATATEAERYKTVIEAVNARAGNLAEDLNSATGYSKELSTALDDFQKALGARFEPAIEQARLGVVSFLKVFKDNPVLTDLAAAAIAGGIALTGLVAVVAAGVPAFLALSAAATAFGVSANFALAGIPLIIGGIVASVTLLALNWDKATTAIKAAGAAMVTFLVNDFQGLSKVLQGALSLDPSQIEEGVQQVIGALAKAKAAYTETYSAITAENKKAETIQNADRAAAAQADATRRKTLQETLIQYNQAVVDAEKLTNEHASADLISLKTKEVAVLKALTAQHSDEEVVQLKTQLQQLRALEADQRLQDAGKTDEFNKAKLLSDEEFAQQDIQIKKQLSAQQIADLKATALTADDIDQKLQKDGITRQITAHNTLLENQKKYGTAAAAIQATIDKAAASQAVTASADLINLQQSTNDTLKTIGKIAAIEDITVKTAQAAINIYEGFSTIPIIGPALGIAGAAAAVAFGAEQISNVVGANEGGLITGGTPGKDSVPALLTPGELVVPEKNFDQVVNAVQAQGDGGSQKQMLALLQSIDSKFSNPQQTIIQGDVMADDSYINTLVRKISDAVQYRHATIHGLKT